MLEEKVRKLIEKDINKAGLIVDKIEFVKEDNIYFLRIFIDKESYVNVEDCVTATKIINPILDESNIIEESYILDVCSKEKEGR
jgi:ribosome maturation factor RimP